MDGKCFATVRSRKCRRVILFADFVSTICAACQLQLLRIKNRSTYLVDTTDSETESTTFDTSAIHVVTDEKNQLQTYEYTPQRH